MRQNASASPCLSSRLDATLLVTQCVYGTPCQYNLNFKALTNLKCDISKEITFILKAVGIFPAAFFIYSNNMTILHGALRWRWLCGHLIGEIAVDINSRIICGIYCSFVLSFLILQVKIINANYEMPKLWIWECCVYRRVLPPLWSSSTHANQQSTS